MRLWCLLIPLFLYTGCGTHYGAVPTNHIVMVNTEGHPVDPSGNIFCEQTDDSRCNGDHSTAIEYPSLTNSQYLKYIDNLTTNLQKGQPCGVNSHGVSYLDQKKANGTPPKASNLCTWGAQHTNRIRSASSRTLQAHHCGRLLSSLP